MTAPSKPSLTPPPQLLPNAIEHRRQLAQAVANLYRGKGNSPVDSFTLATSATQTTLTDARIGYYSIILFMPQTANAAAEIGGGTMYVSQSTQINGSAVVSHANSTQTDRIFRAIIMG